MRQWRGRCSAIICTVPAFQFPCIAVATLMQKSLCVECCQENKDEADAVRFLETKNYLSNFWSLQHLSLVTLHESVKSNKSFSIATSEDTAGLVPFRLGSLTTLLNLPMGICRGGKPTSRCNAIFRANKHATTSLPNACYHR